MHAACAMPLLLALLLLLLLLPPPPVRASTPATIAFHISVTPGTVPLLHRFFLRIYHPSNHYLITVPPSAHPLRHTRQFQRPNVHIRQTDPFIPHGVSEAIAVLDAMSHFLDRDTSLHSPPSFDFFIHTTPADYPLLPPARIRELLSHPAFSATNFFSFSPAASLPFYSSEVDRVHYDAALSFNRSLTLSEGLPTSDFQLPGHAHRTYHYARTDKFMVVTHAFVKFAADSMASKRLLLSLADAGHVFQRFFGTLATSGGAHSIGKVVKSTSLRCVDRGALSRVVGGLGKDGGTRVPSVEFVRGVDEPCFFVAPIEVERAASLRARDDIDHRLLIEPGMQGRPQGVPFYEVVKGRLEKQLRQLTR